ncbi:MAG: hypothetical protein HUU34_19505 [Saprospiraceae bacterium]|jgi:hypothetical protein|nr:hypothetical protein [Saprospiraceae bacterium]
MIICKILKNGLLLLLALPTLPLVGQETICRRFILPEELREVSGLYYAGPDSLWWHNDGGDSPRLLLTDNGGKMKKEVMLPAAINEDWEDLTADKSGFLYIGDFGNNLNTRRDLRVYRFHPATGMLDSIRYVYPDQREFPPPAARANFDVEAFFWHNDSLHLFTKNRLVKGDYYAKHYVLPATPGDYTVQLRDSIYLKKRVVTAAAISPDGNTVALLSYYFRLRFGFLPTTRTTLWLLSGYQDGAFLQGKVKEKKIRKGPVPSQFETIDFLDNQSVLIASERTPVYRQKARKVRIAVSN